MKKIISALAILGLLVGSYFALPKIRNFFSEESDETAPLFLTTMTHMESGFHDDEEEDIFLWHIDQLNYGMDLADEYDATLTIESELPFAEANEKWGYNMMQEILDRGHGVGTHCDIGGPNLDEVIEEEDLIAEFREHKAAVDALVGSENNHGCSGGGSLNDWVKAASIAGFQYINGIVGMHLLAIDQENRPDPSWTDEYISKEAYHYSVPEDIEDRLYMMRLKDLEDFEDDGDEGVIVINNGEIGRLSMLEENSDHGVYSPTGGEMTMEDVDIALATIKKVAETRDPSRVAKLTIYFAVDEFDEDNEDVLRYFFEETQKLQNEGVIQWASQWEAVKTYMEMEGGIVEQSSSGPGASRTEDANNNADEIYTLFTLNVHDWVFPEDSAETVSRVIDIHEKYDVPVDIYVDDPIFQYYADEEPELIRKLKTSDVVAMSYHVRAPNPTVNGFDNIGLSEMDADELYRTLLDYEEHQLNMETGTTTSKPGGYEYVKDTIGYAPLIVGISTEGVIGKILAEIYAEKGATFMVLHEEVDFGEEQWGLAVRPEHAEIKLYELFRDYEGGEDVYDLALAKLSGEGQEFINFKYHENNFYATSTPFWPVYWTDSEKSTALSPPYDTNASSDTPDYRSQAKQDMHWSLYENTVKYAALHADQFHPINAFDLEEML